MDGSDAEFGYAVLDPVSPDSVVLPFSCLELITCFLTEYTASRVQLKLLISKMKTL